MSLTMVVPQSTRQRNAGRRLEVPSQRSFSQLSGDDAVDTGVGIGRIYRLTPPIKSEDREADPREKFSVFRIIISLQALIATTRMQPCARINGYLFSSLR
ncbi:hypothetical protein HFO92_26705 [Rhizobium leguminosarum]|nr:hypothetical protein [Rhizobium leguminosarum]